MTNQEDVSGSGHLTVFELRSLTPRGSPPRSQISDLRSQFEISDSDCFRSRISIQISCNYKKAVRSEIFKSEISAEQRPKKDQCRKTNEQQGSSQKTTVGPQPTVRRLLLPPSTFPPDSVPPARQ